MVLPFLAGLGGHLLRHLPEPRSRRRPGPVSIRRHSERYGLIPQAANPRFNPDGLPIGISKTTLRRGPRAGGGAAIMPASPARPATRGN